LKPAILLVIFTLLTEQEIDFVLFPTTFLITITEQLENEIKKNLSKEETGFVTKKNILFALRLNFTFLKCDRRIKRHEKHQKLNIS